MLGLYNLILNSIGFLFWYNTLMVTSDLLSSITKQSDKSLNNDGVEMFQQLVAL